MNKIKDYIIIILLLITIAGGLWIYFKTFKPPITKPLLKPTVALKQGEKAKVLISGNVIQATTEVSSAIKVTNPRAKKREVIIDKNNKVIIKEQDLDLFPLNIHASLQIPVLEPTIGVRLIRYKQYGASANINLKGMSLSAERDLYDIFPVLQNTYAGVFYRANYDGYTNYGFQIGVHL